MYSKSIQVIVVVIIIIIIIGKGKAMKCILSRIRLKKCSRTVKHVVALNLTYDK